MPLLALPKQWFDPHFPFVECLMVGKGLPIGFYSVQIVGEKGPMHMPTTLAFGTGFLHRAGVADSRIGSILHAPPACLPCGMLAVIGVLGDRYSGHGWDHK